MVEQARGSCDLGEEALFSRHDDAVWLLSLYFVSRAALGRKVGAHLLANPSQFLANSPGSVPTNVVELPLERLESHVLAQDLCSVRASSLLVRRH